MIIKVQDIDSVFHIQEPWYIESCVFDEKKEQLDCYITFPKGATFSCSNCNEEHQKVQDIADYNRTWRHLNFLEYPCYIHAELPRTNCQKCGKIHRVHVP